MSPKKQTKDFQNAADMLKKEPISPRDADDLLAEKIAEFQKDPITLAKIRSLGLNVGQVKENVGDLIDYQNDHAYCAHCPGMEKCAKENPFYQIDLSMGEDGSLVRTYGPCPQKKEKDRQDNRYLRADFPEEWRYSALLDSVERTKSKISVFVRMSQIVLGEESTERNWIYLTGNMGSGRSYLAVAFANSFADSNNVKVAVCDSSLLVNELRESSIHDPARFKKSMEAYENVALLVLDGFGDEYKSDFALSTVLFPLLSYRAQNGLPVCFCSDFSLSEIQTMYSGRGLGPRGRQLASLIKSRSGKCEDISGVPVR